MSLEWADGHFQFYKGHLKLPQEQHFSHEIDQYLSILVRHYFNFRYKFKLSNKVVYL